MTAPTEPSTVIAARALLQKQTGKEEWLKSAVELVTDIEIDTLEGLDIGYYWIPQYGTVRYMLDGKGLSKNKLIWDRPDGGPNIPFFAMSLDKEVLSYFFMYIWLHAFMIVELNKAGFASYAEVGGPPDNWRDLTIYVDGSEVTRVQWACALTGTICGHELNDKGSPVIDKNTGNVKTIETKGHVIIAKTKEKAFF